MNHNFIEILHIALGKSKELSRPLTDAEWDEVYAEAEKQSLIGFCFAGIERLPKHLHPYMELLMDWLWQAEYIKNRNELVSERCRDITCMFAGGVDFRSTGSGQAGSPCGYRSVVLKGQGTALLYPKPELRTSGDIDIWVEGKRKDVIGFLKSKGYKISSVFIHHIDVEIYNDVTIEVHTSPSYSYSPFRWRKYKKWFAQQKAQFELLDSSLGYAYPSVSFNAVYSLLHIFRHVFHEGIGLRQLLDYYYILQHMDDNIRHEAMNTLRWFGLERFASAVMYVEQTMFASSEEVKKGSKSSKGHIDWLLCEPCPEAGQFLLEDIMQNGNFGKYDEHTREAHAGGTIKLYLHNVSRILKMLKYYPSEVLWAPFWKPAHYVWRKMKGY